MGCGATSWFPFGCSDCLGLNLCADRYGYGRLLTTTFWFVQVFGWMLEPVMMCAACLSARSVSCSF